MLEKKIENDSIDFKEEIQYLPTKTGQFIPVNDEEKKPDTMFLYFAVIIGTLSTATGTASFAWISPVLPKLLSNDTNVNPLDKPVTTVDISLIAGLPVLTGLVGSLVAGPLSDKVGRKRFIHISALAMLLCNVLIAFSSKAIYIIIIRCVFFICFSGMLTIVSVFVTEICEDHNRAKHGCIMGVFLPLGTVYAFVFGPPFSVRIFTLITTAPLVISSVLLIFVPETPIFLLSKGRQEDCRIALKQLRSNKNSKELDLEYNKINETLSMKPIVKSNGIVSLFKARESRIGLLLVIIPFAGQFSSGGPILMPFLGPIFSKVMSGLSGNNIAIIIGSVKCLTFFVAPFVVERTGRKPLLFYSSLGCGLPLIIIGCFYYLKHIDSPIANQCDWLPVVSFIVFIISYSVGLGPVPPSLVGEMFNTDVRSDASSFIFTLVGVLICVLTSGFPILAEIAGLHWCFWIFAFNSFFVAACIYILLPETRGRSLIEIQNILKNYKFSLKKA